PIIMADGFPGHTYKEMYDKLSAEGFLGKLLASGHDLVMLGYDDGTTYIQRNGFVMVACIEKIKSIVGNTPLIVGGASMGGIVARYALCYMEKTGLNHQAKMYLSFDSPHRGAHVPLGDQFFIQAMDLAGYESARKHARDLRSVAAQQLVLLYVDFAKAVETETPLVTKLHGE